MRGGWVRSVSSIVTSRGDRQITSSSHRVTTHGQKEWGKDVVGSVRGHEVGRRFLADDEPVQEQHEVPPGPEASRRVESPRPVIVGRGKRLAEATEVPLE